MRWRVSQAQSAVLLASVAAFAASMAAMALGVRALAVLALPGFAILAAAGVGRLRQFALSWTRSETAWVLVLAATLSVDTLTTAQVFSGGLGGAQLARLGLVAGALLMVAPSLRRTLVAPLAPVVRSYVAFVAFAGLSILWSAGRIATAGKVLEIGAAVVILLAVVTQVDAKGRLERLFQITLATIGLLLGVIAIGYFSGNPAFTSYVMLADRLIMSGGPIALSSNAIARLGAIGAVVCIAIAVRPRLAQPRRIVALVWAVYFGMFPFLAVGRTGIASLVLGLAAVLATRWPVRTALLVFAGGMVASPALIDIGREYFLRGQSTEQFLGLSGRINWWQSAVDVVREAPFTGFGYGVGGRVAFSSIENDVTSGLHNGVLETFAGVGILGLAIWLFAVLQVVVSSARRMYDRVDVHIFAVLLPLLLGTVLSNGIGGWMSIELGLFLLVLGRLHLDYLERRPASQRGALANAEARRRAAFKPGT